MKLRLASFWFQVVLTAGFLVLLAWRVDISEALQTLPNANWAWVLPGLLAFTFSKALHTARWRLFLGNHRNVPFFGLFGIFLVHNMANAVLLLRAGDVLRIQTTSQRYSIPRSELTATVVVVETLLDGFAFILLVGLAFGLGAIPGVLRATFWGMAGLAFLGLVLGIACARWLKPEHLDRVYPIRWLSDEARSGIKSLAGQFLDGMRALRDVRLAVPAATLGLAGWLCEAVAYWFFGHAFGLGLHFSEYLLIMMTANFAVSIPITPSGIGPYEVATQALAAGLGADPALATGFAIGTHLTFIIWITLTGLAAMWLMRLTPDEIFYFSREEPQPQAEVT
ncbi:MAG: lysylphosphatidylglycerol synthase transmembrane domain-containing protein [Dehalococcoidia bacterium]